MRPPFTQFPFLILQIFLSLDPSPPWNLFSALAITLVCALIITPSLLVNLNIDTGFGYLDYLIGCTLGACIVLAFCLLVIARPLRNFKCAANGDGEAPKFWWEKFWDSVVQSAREIARVKNIPPAPRQPRHLFVIRSTLRAAWNVVLFELGRLYVWYNPAFSPTTFGTQHYLARCIDTTVFIGLTYWCLNAAYFTMAAASVALRLHEPRVWPDAFGAWSDAYTVRRFWGTTWHQILRSSFTVLGKATSSILGFKPGTLGSSYTQLYVAFFTSGFLHTLGDIAISTFSTSSASQTFFSMPVFLLQAIVITFEDVFIGIARRLGIRSNAWTRALGNVWVMVWFAWCIPEYVGNMVRAGGLKGMTNFGAGGDAMGLNVVQVMAGLLGFDIGGFAESWFGA